jgi:hypothetical protein
MNRKVFKKKYSEVMIEKCYKGQNLLSFFHCKQGSQLTRYVKTIFSIFEKIDNHNNRSDINIKTSNSEKVANLTKQLFTFSAPNDLSNKFLKYCTRALNHPVYSE